MKYKIIVDKQSRTNPSNEKKEYIVNIEELRCKGDIYDSLIITKDEDYVMRRLSLNEYGVLTILPEAIKEPLQDINIELFEGDNYIYLIDLQGNKFYAEYLIKNEFNELYVTQKQLMSTINESAGQIELSVSQKLDEELTGANIILKINEDNDSEIQIGADKIDINGKKAKFKTDIESTYIYSNDDLDNIRKYIMGNITLTSAQQELYDIDKDGKVTAGDYVRIKNIVETTEGTAKIEGTFEIDPDSASRSLILRDLKGNIITSIGLLGMQTQSFNSQYVYANTSQIENLTVNETSINELITRVEKLEQGVANGRNN